MIEQLIPVQAAYAELLTLPIPFHPIQSMYMSRSMHLCCGLTARAICAVGFDATLNGLFGPDAAVGDFLTRTLGLNYEGLVGYTTGFDMGPGEEQPSDYYTRDATFRAALDLGMADARAMGLVTEA